LKTTRRGYQEDDNKFFSLDKINVLKKAQEDVQYLLDRGYKIKPIIELVGGHHQLSLRQRMALQRSTATNLQYEKRSSKELSINEIKNGCLHVDGFNLIITLEVALSKSLLILGSDGVLRDLAGLRGTYFIIDKTDIALNLICQTLKKCYVTEVKFYLDAPVSNSGKLKLKIIEHLQKLNIPFEVLIVKNPDVILSKLERVVTGDSVILDECKSWFNLSKKIVDDYIKDAWIINFNNTIDIDVT
jgi:hypothetical protein